MIYTSEQYKRDKRAMLGEFNRAIAEAAELRKPASSSIPAGPQTAEECRMAIDVQQVADSRPKE